ncbi:hypothetical protein ACJMK2_038860 [Sinanodonta woodiana]|uniref:Uncharacterized protein n=1 Tax=Sinanodonta woodiana TaxID=1069815 RepID=A0ABD3WDK3_SINWO
MKFAQFEYSDSFDVTPEVQSAFDHNGFIIVRKLFDCDEIDKIKKALEEYGLVENYSYGIRDRQGKEPRLLVWSFPGEDVTGMVSRCEKVVNTCEKLMGGDELYHYHSKIVMKEPKTGGGFEWHQDYGYWYQNGCLFPDLVSLMFALDPCTKENGGLQVLVGSHKCGRINHAPVEGQQGADIEQVGLIKKKCEHRYINLQPGDGLFIHCNLLKCSGPNESDSKQWSFNCAYNKKSNDPAIDHHHPQYTELHKVPNTALKECQKFDDFNGKYFLDPRYDKTVIASYKSWEASYEKNEHRKKDVFILKSN